MIYFNSSLPLEFLSLKFVFIVKYSPSSWTTRSNYEIWWKAF